MSKDQDKATYAGKHRAKGTQSRSDNADYTGKRKALTDSQKAILSMRQGKW